MKERQHCAKRSTSRKIWHAQSQEVMSTQRIRASYICLIAVAVTGVGVAKAVSTTVCAPVTPIGPVRGLHIHIAITVGPRYLSVRLVAAHACFNTGLQVLKSLQQTGLTGQQYQ